LASPRDEEGSKSQQELAQTAAAAAIIQDQYKVHQAQQSQASIDTAQLDLPEDATDYQRLLCDITEERGAFGQYLEGYRVTIAGTYADLGASTLWALRRARQVFEKLKSTLGSDSAFWGFLEAISEKETSITLARLISGVEAVGECFGSSDLLTSDFSATQLVAALKFWDIDDDGRISLRDIIKVVCFDEEDKRKAKRKVMGTVHLQAKSSNQSAICWFDEKLKILISKHDLGDSTLILTPGNFRDLMKVMGLVLSPLELELVLEGVIDSNGAVSLEEFKKMALGNSSENPGEGECREEMG